MGRVLTKGSSHHPAEQSSLAGAPSSELAQEEKQVPFEMVPLRILPQKLRVTWSVQFNRRWVLPSEHPVLSLSCIAKHPRCSLWLPEASLNWLCPLALGGPSLPRPTLPSGHCPWVPPGGWEAPELKRGQAGLQAEKVTSACRVWKAHPSCLSPALTSVAHGACYPRRLNLLVCRRSRVEVRWLLGASPAGCLFSPGSSPGPSRAPKSGLALVRR